MFIYRANKTEESEVQANCFYKSFITRLCRNIFPGRTFSIVRSNIINYYKEMKSKEDNVIIYIYRMSCKNKSKKKVIFLHLRLRFLENSV